MLRSAVNLLLILLLIISAAEAGSLSVVGTSRWVQVGKVIDGDTFHATSGEKIRLLGIDAPEVAHDRHPGEPLGYQATNALKSLIAGKAVRLAFDKEKRDNYGRTLAHIYLRDGTWVNGELVRHGLALTYTFTPNVRAASDLLRLETEARREMRGIWKESRFKVLESSEVSRRHIGQFRVVRGTIEKVSSWRYRMGKLNISIPRRSRVWFSQSQLPQHGKRHIVRGTIRTSSKGALFLALHSPWDME